MSTETIIVISDTSSSEYSLNSEEERIQSKCVHSMVGLFVFKLILLAYWCPVITEYHIGRWVSRPITPIKAPPLYRKLKMKNISLNMSTSENQFVNFPYFLPVSINHLRSREHSVSEKMIPKTHKVHISQRRFSILRSREDHCNYQKNNMISILFTVLHN